MSLPSFRVLTFERREQQYSNLLAAWSFDEGAGTTAGDSSGHGLSLTLSGSATWVAGHSGASAISNSGTGSAIRANWTTLSSPVTIMCWAKPTDLSSGFNRPLIGIWSGTDSSTSTEIAIWAQRGDFSTSDVLQGNVRVDGGLVAINHTALALNTWVHLALSFDGTSLHLFRNGVEVNTIANTGGITGGTFNFLVTPNSANAQVDDVRVFGAALSAAQVASLMGDPVIP